MNRYGVFGGERYYPKGGWLDYVGSTNDIAYARSLVDRIRSRENGSGDWAYVVDFDDDGRLVYGEVAWYQDLWAGTEVVS